MVSRTTANMIVVDDGFVPGSEAADEEEVSNLANACDCREVERLIDYALRVLMFGLVKTPLAKPPNRVGVTVAVCSERV